ncbi:MAG: short-chain dehydrogenase [Bacteroidota bacterium]
MQIKNSKVLVLGGWGLVGSAICHKLMQYSPAKLIVSSLYKNEAEDAVRQLRKEYKNKNPKMFVAKWGNIFCRKEFENMQWGEVLNDKKMRKSAVNDILDELNDELLGKYSLYSLIKEIRPDVVIDCINTATAIAYQDIYSTTRTVRQNLESGKLNEENVERLMASLYMPQLIRHVQILYRGLQDAGSTLYVKVGTSGTGGMGLNIPYTHSEERPSRVLLAKAAVAGAQSLLLFLMARTPDGPIIKEIKPTAAIAWKRIAYDKVIRKGKTIPLCDLTIEKARSVSENFKFEDSKDVTETGDVFKSVFIDTGENGIFSKGEFQAIGSLGQMEIVTPEEIADCVVFEILGGNSGHDIVQGLDSFTLGPTYRGGMLYSSAVKKLEELETENNVASIAFEMLGPPRLSKLLFEAHLLKRICVSMENVVSAKPEFLAQESLKLLKEDKNLRTQMLSIGLVVLLPDGKKYLRGRDVKIPVNTGEKELKLTTATIEKWCTEGWIDLKTENFKKWQKRIKKIIEQSKSIPDGETSSRYTYNKEYWNNFKEIDAGKIAGWLFEFEDSGWRFKR